MTTSSLPPTVSLIVSTNPLKLSHPVVIERADTRSKPMATFFPKQLELYDAHALAGRSYKTKSQGVDVPPLSMRRPRSAAGWHHCAGC